MIRHQRPELYAATHHAIARAVDTALPGARSCSIDELSVDLGHRDDPETILQQVKAAIRKAVGPIITVSCGIAPSSYLAKTAAEANKPDASVVWRHSDLPDVYDALELSDLPGLGPATEARLRRRGIDTVRALYEVDRTVAQWAWGNVVGRHTHRWLHGEDLRLRERPRQRISHGRVLEPRLRTWTQARPIMRFLITCTLHRCRQTGIAPRKLALEVIGDEHKGWRGSAGVEPTNREAPALRAVSAVWDRIARGARSNPVRFTVTAVDLAPWPSRQCELIERKGARLQSLLDSVRDRYGARSLTLGEANDPARYTGLKISFQHAPTQEEFEWHGIEMPAVGPPVTRPDRPGCGTARSNHAARGA